MKSGALWLALALGAVLRLWHADRDFNLDEFYTLRAAQGDWQEISEKSRTDSYPPGSYLMLHLMQKTSDHPVWLRLPGILSGLICVFLFFLCLNRGPLAAVPPWVVVLFACLPMQVWASQYLRGIIHAQAGFLLALWACTAVPKDKGLGWGWGLIFALGATVAAWTFYLAAVFFLPMTLWWLRNCLHTRQGWGPFWFSHGVILLACVPLGEILLPQLQAGNIVNNLYVSLQPGLWAGAFPLGMFLRGLAGAWGLDDAFAANEKALDALYAPSSVVGILAVLLLLLLVGLRSHRRNPWIVPRPALGFFMGAFFLWPVIFAVFSALALHTAITPRYFCLSNAVTVLMWGLLFHGSAPWQKVSLIALCAARALGIPASLVDYRGACGWLAGSVDPQRETVVLLGSSDALRYHQKAFFQKYQSHFVFTDLREVDSRESAGLGRQSTTGPEKIAGKEKVVVFGSGDKILGPRNRIYENLRKSGFVVSDVHRFRHLDIPTYVSVKTEK